VFFTVKKSCLLTVDTYVYISVLFVFNVGGCRYSHWKYFFDNNV